MRDQIPGWNVHWYDRDGMPISQEEYIRLQTQQRDYCQVALTEYGDISVSTIWLGLDHGWGRTERPIIFETMVFKDNYADGQWRWCTEAEAKAGHVEVCSATFRDMEVSDG